MNIGEPESARPSGAVELRRILNNLPPPIWVSVLVVLLGTVIVAVGVFMSTRFDHGPVLGALSYIGSVSAMAGLTVYLYYARTARRLSSNKVLLRSAIDLVDDAPLGRILDRHVDMLQEVVDELDRRGSYENAELVANFREGFYELRVRRLHGNREA